MRNSVFAFIVCAAVVALSSSLPTEVSSATPVPVLLELFTSEGCSSCPPADKFLRSLRTEGVNGAKLILLGEHVDYWNQLGWKDRFSSSQYSQRQSAYGSRMGLSSVYTPQMVIDGMKEIVGNDEAAIRAAIRRDAMQEKPAKVEPRLTGENTIAVNVNGERLPGVAVVMMALTEDGLKTQVDAGENGGRTLLHTAVVRRLETLGKLTNGTFSREVNLAIDRNWDREQLKAVFWVENSDGVLGANAIDLAKK